MKNNLHQGASGHTFQFARDNRQCQTGAEILPWENLRNRKLKGFKFRRQHPIARFIADFYCHQCNLVIEVDGEYHDDAEQKRYDEERTKELLKLGIKVLRFSNHEVERKMEWVLNEIRKHLRSCSGEQEEP